jgi:hypothetical protein
LVAKPIEELNVPSVTFLAEQDGEVEKELKARIVPILTRDLAVSAAYLVRVCYGECAEQKVVLALLCPPALQLVEAIGREFSAMFKSTENLDIIFLNPDQLLKVRLVSKPFFEQDVHPA